MPMITIRSTLVIDLATGFLHHTYPVPKGRAFDKTHHAALAVSPADTGAPTPPGAVHKGIAFHHPAIGQLHRQNPALFLFHIYGAALQQHLYAGFLDNLFYQGLSPPGIENKDMLT